MYSADLLTIIKLLLPEFLITHFELTKHKIEGEDLRFYFTELNNTPEEFKDIKLSSKGFFPEATVQDFPIRGKNVLLHITRRRWLNQSTHKVVIRDWDLVAKGARITSEFITF